MKLILNESELIKKIIEENYIDIQTPIKTLNILSKYYFRNNMKKEQVRLAIEDYASKHIKGYNVVSWENRIKKIVSYGNRNKDKINDISQINITGKEIEIIKSIEDKNLQMFAFGLLVYAKIYNILNKNDVYWVNAADKEIFKDCNLKVTIKQQLSMFYELVQLNLIEVSKKVNCTNVKVLYACEDDDIVITVKDFNNIGYEYLRYIGDKIKNCEVCGCLIKITSNCIKYCKPCFRLVENKRLLNIMKKKKSLRNRNI